MFTGISTQRHVRNMPPIPQSVFAFSGAIWSDDRIQGVSREKTCAFGS